SSDHFPRKLFRGTRPTMLWYFTHGPFGAASMTGKIGSSGASESMLLVVVSRSLFLKKPGLVRTSLLVRPVSIAGKMISFLLTRRVYSLAKSLPWCGVPMEMTRLTDGLGWK